MRHFYLINSLLITCLLTSVSAFAVYPSRGNGTWTYDAIWDANGKKTGNQGGLFAPQIIKYNSGANAGSKITQIFSYGSDLEMACNGAQDTSDACSSNMCSANMWIYYTDKPKKLCPNSSGYETTLAYYQAFQNSADADSVVIIPIVDR